MSTAAASALETALARERAAREQAEYLLQRRTRELAGVHERLATVEASNLHRTAELELLYEIAFYALQDPDTPTILRAFLRSVCTRCGWPCGHVLFPDPQDEGVLVSSGIWETDEEFHADALALAAAEVRLAAGEGTPGQALETGKLIYCEAIDELQNSPRRELFARFGLRTAFALPVRAFGRIIAVAEFFTQAPVIKDEEFIRIVETAALQLGTGIERREAEIQLRQNVDNLQALNEQLTEAKDQLVQSEKLVSIGQLAAGIAHEINNPVGFVMSNIASIGAHVDTLKAMLNAYRELEAAVHSRDGHATMTAATNAAALREREDVDFVLVDAAEIISESTEGMLRVKEIVEGLKAFARTDSGEFEPADVNAILDLTVKMVWNELKYKCEIERDYDALPTIVCSSGKLSQVFTNLLVNAGHAIEGRGTIGIVTRDRGDFVEVRISDTGKGIPAEVINDIFNPFFTTKPVGEGTGLGLSIGYGIVKDHHGRITVDSTPGKGTTFTIKLPIDPHNQPEKFPGTGTLELP